MLTKQKINQIITELETAAKQLLEFNTKLEQILPLE